MPSHEEHADSRKADPPGPTHTSDPAQSIQAEHDELRALLADMQEANLADVIPLLGQLRTILLEHFETEEGPDGFEAITEKQPQFLARLSEIFDEHGAFLAQLEQISARAESCAKEQQSVLDDIRALAHNLHEHEAKENELLGDVLYTDLGGHD